MNIMKYELNELTNAGKRNLLRMLCDELTHDEINKLVEPYASRLELDEMREPYIVINATENDDGRSQILWIDVNDVETHILDTEE
jgi:hypothetical protein